MKCFEGSWSSLVLFCYNSICKLFHNSWYVYFRKPISLQRFKEWLSIFKDQFNSSAAKNKISHATRNWETKKISEEKFISNTAIHFDWKSMQNRIWWNVWKFLKNELNLSLRSKNEQWYWMNMYLMRSKYSREN